MPTLRATHKYAEIFPLMDPSSAEWSGLVEDIKKNGLNRPIVLLDDQILDGRNRERACLEAGIEPRYVDFTRAEKNTNDPLAFVWSENYCRRHLSPGQAAVALARRTEVMLAITARAEAARIAGNTEGGKKNASEYKDKPKSLAPALKTSAVHTHIEAAKIAGVAPRVMQAAITFASAERGEKGMKVSAPVARAFATGRMPVEAAAVAVRRDVEEQRAAFAMLKEKKQEPTKANIKHAFAEIGREQQRVAALKEAAAAPATAPDLRLGDWRTVLADVTCDALICDPPYGAVTHDATTTRADASSAAGLTPTYACWTSADVREFVESWFPRVRGWMVVLTDSELIPAWRAAYEAAGRYSFAPVPCVIRGMSVRLQGDGPSSWAVYAMVARPRTSQFARWGTLPGAYVNESETGAASGRGKPRALMESIVRDYSRAGNVVCDPMAGWGSTLVAALREGRRVVGGEIDAQAHAEAMLRIKQR